MYMLARFEDSPPGGSARLCAEVTYVGETTRQSLDERLRDFGNSAFSGREGHAGGRTFFQQFKLRRPPHWLHVATTVPQASPAVLGALIKHVERSIIWQYAKRCGKLPRCNSV